MNVDHAFHSVDKLVLISYIPTLDVTDPAMFRFIIFGTFLASNPAVGQTLLRSDLIEVVRLAFEESKLPIELTSKPGSSFHRELPDSFIIIKANKELNIERQYIDGNVKVWEGEDIFLYNLFNWVDLIATTRRKDIARIRYKTNPLGSKIGEKVRCYSGEIRGRLTGKGWILIKSKFDEIECDYSRPN